GLVPRTPGRSRLRTLEHDVGGLDPRRGQGPRLESELADGLRGDEGDHPVRAALDLDLRHHRVGADSRDQAPEAVSGAHGAVAVACALPPALALALALGVPGAAHASARSWATRASSAPSIVLRPAWSACAVRVPRSTQRRTVSSLTPRSEAASLIRRCVME